jgi:methylthioribose-1-phosphate isomerase
MKRDRHDTIRAVQWVNNRVRLLDQRRLPREVVFLDFDSMEALAGAITNMVVRGAPAIGITAAYGMVLGARQCYHDSAQPWQQRLREAAQRLLAARPTAVNLKWAVERMLGLVETLNADPIATLLDEARRIHTEDVAANRRIGEFGCGLLSGGGVLTHCNAGSLATGGYGTALGVIRSGYAAGGIETIYADETRPWFQGSRLTAWELARDGIPVTLICEGAAASLMAQQRVRWVIVGADRIAANGDVANKIGTYNLAVNARYHGVKFMVAAPTSSIDLDTVTGKDITIETRAPDEILALHGYPISAPGAGAWNPVFDITPADLVDVLITEKGVVRQPAARTLTALMGA